MSDRGFIARHAGTILAGQLAIMGFGVTDTIVSGRYYQWKNGVLSQRRSAEMSYEQDLARALWKDSETLTHLSATEAPVRLK